MVRRYEFYFRMVKTILTNEGSEREKYCFFILPRENKIPILKPPYNFLFII